MSLTSLELMKSEARFSDNIQDSDVQPFIDHASREIQRIFDSLDSFGNDIFNLKDDYYEIAYSDLPALILGSGTSYDTLITAIESGYGKSLTTAQKNILITMGRDFKKAETLMAVSYSIVPLSLRPSAKGGFVRTIPQNASGGDIDIIDLGESKQIRDYYYNLAMQVIGPYLFDHEGRDDSPDTFVSENFALALCGNPHTNKKSLFSVREKRE